MYGGVGRSVTASLCTLFVTPCHCCCGHVEWCGHVVSGEERRGCGSGGPSECREEVRSGEGQMRVEVGAQ